MANPLSKAKNASGLSQAELSRREQLHDQFTKEIAGLKGKAIHLVVFELSDQSFAIEISKINEVVKTPTITKMPRTPEYIPGIGKIRGKGIILLDLAAKLGLQETVTLPERSAYTVVVSSERFTIGVLVPEVPLSKKTNGESIQPTGLDLAGTPEDETYIKGIIHEEDSQVFFIDIDELIEGDRMSARVNHKP